MTRLPDWIPTESGEWSLREPVVRRLVLCAVAARALPDLIGVFVARGAAIVSNDIVGALGLIGLNVWLSQLGLLGVGVYLLVYAVIIWKLLPRLTPDEPPASDILGKHWQRAVSTIVIVGIGTALGGVSLFPFADPPLAVVAATTGVELGLSPRAVLWFLLVAIGFWAGTTLLLGCTWWRTATPRRKVELLVQLTGEPPNSKSVSEEIERATRSDVVGAASRGFTLVASGGAIVVPVLFAGGIYGAVVALFPVPETILLVAGLSVALRERFPESSAKAWIPEVTLARVDLESRLIVVTRHIRTGQKGLSVIVLIFVGFLVSGSLVLGPVGMLLLLVLALLTTDGAVEGVVTVTMSYPLFSVNVVGVLCSLVASGLFVVWFWVRMTDRVPNYLAHWDATHAVGDDIDIGEDRRPLRTRPRVGGLLLAPVLPLLAMPLSSGVELHFTRQVAMTVLWSTALLLLADVVRETYRESPQHPRDDGWVLLAGLTSTLSSMGLFVWSLSPENFDYWLPLGGVLLIVSGIFFRENVKRYLDHGADEEWFEEWGLGELLKQSSVTLHALYGGPFTLVGGYFLISGSGPRTVGWILFGGGLFILSLAVIDGVLNWLE